ncbi:prepilin-type N-terminal cleavage/methylation domain-containing protein [Singulisphaera rosea]
MRRSTARRAFTLVELLVVITIILIVSAIVLPTVINAVNNRQVSEAARILQAALAGARDAAIRANSPRGIRLLPDPTLTDPPFSAGLTAGTKSLVYSRLIQIEIPGDYTEGKISIIPDNLPPWDAMSNPRTYYSAYPYAPSLTYPDGFDTVGNSVVGKVLRIEQAAYDNSATPILNPPTSWWWNIRLGDQIRIGDSGRYYTVVGPLTQNPYTTGNNPELFVNDGPPGTASSIVRPYGTGGTVTANVEFLYVVNGQGDLSVQAKGPAKNYGYTDAGWDGFDNNYDNPTVYDEVTFVPENIDTSVTPNIVTPAHYGEWETETWTGAGQNVASFSVINTNYTIKRRPVPVEGARETALPGSVVIDASSWNSSLERSLLPIDKFSLTCDIMVNADGQVVQQTSYSSNTSFQEPFFHFWLSERTDVHAIDTTLTPQLPMPAGTPLYASRTTDIKGDQMLVTMFIKSGLVTTSKPEIAIQIGTDASNNPIYSSGFLGGTNRVNVFRDAQLGVRDAK